MDELGLSFEKRDFREMPILIHNYVGKIIAMANTGHGSTNVTSVRTVAEYIYWKFIAIYERAVGTMRQNFNFKCCCAAFVFKFVSLELLRKYADCLWIFYLLSEICTEHYDCGYILIAVARFRNGLDTLKIFKRHCIELLLFCHGFREKYLFIYFFMK